MTGAELKGTGAGGAGLGGREVTFERESGAIHRQVLVGPEGGVDFF